MLSYQFLVLLAALPPLYIGLSFTGGEGLMDLVMWFGDYYTLARFMSILVGVFTLWALAGIWALMRAELQEPVGPWLWLGFAAFTMAFFAGVRTLPVGPNLAIALIDIPSVPSVVLMVGLVLVYVIVLLEPKGRVGLRCWAAKLEAGDCRAAVTRAPRSVLAVVAAAIGVLVAAIGFADYPPQRAGTLHAFFVSALLFALRDVGFIYWMCLGRRDGCGEGVAAIILIRTYFLLPNAVSVSFLRPVSALFAPAPYDGAGAVLQIWSMAAPALEVALVGWLLRRRWRQVAAADGEVEPEERQ